MTVHRRLRGEEGASLLLALAFLTLFSVILVSLMGLASASSKNTVVTRNRVGLTYAADAGVEWGVQKLAASGCPSEPSSFTSLGTFPTQVNGKTVTVRCRTTDFTTSQSGGGGLSPVMNGRAAIIRTSTSPAISVTGNTNGAPTSVFQGNIYSRGAITAPSGAPIRVEGNLTIGSQACPPLPANVTVTGTCSRSTTIPVTVPNPPKVVIPGPAPPSKLNGPTCTILYPGKYTSAVNFNTAQTYLASGTYYFENTGDLNFQGSVFGGKPGAGESQQVTGAGATPCATDAIAQTQAGSGVYNAANAGSGITIVLGGNSVFRVQGGSTKIEFFSRVPKTTSPPSPDSAATPHVSVWARTTTAGSQGGTYVPVTQVPFRTQEKTATVVIHGATYLPESEANLREPLNPSAPNAGIFMGGLVANKLVFDLQGNGSASDVARVAGGGVVMVTVPSKTVVEATAASTTGGANTVVTAVIDRPTSAVESWRQG